MGKLAPAAIEKRRLKMRFRQLERRRIDFGSKYVSQQRLAVFAGISTSEYWNFLIGIKTPTEPVMAALESTLDGLIVCQTAMEVAR